jgi:hypothetical protein
MNEQTTSTATLARKPAARALSYLTPVVGLYTLFLIWPFVRGEDGYAGLSVIRSIADGIARLTGLVTGHVTAAAFGTVPPSDFDHMVHAGLYYIDGFAVCIAASAGVMVAGKALSRVLFVGWPAFIAEVRSKGFTSAVAGSAVE